MPSIGTIALNYLYNILCAASQWCNALIGGDPAESLSSRIGKSIRAGGWANRVPWPAFARAHFLASITDDRGANTAFGRAMRP